jgi:hypothetical protein
VTTEPLDAIALEVWWSRLVAIADEAATTLPRTAFSTIIRESNGSPHHRSGGSRRHVGLRLPGGRPDRR